MADLPRPIHPPTSPPLAPLLVVPWHDPVVDALGFDPRARYVETFWLSLLGPTSTWLMRRLAIEFDRQPDGFSLDAADAARSIGIGSRGGTKGPFHKAIERCCRFGLVRDEEHGILGVRQRVPPLTRAQAGRLPRHLRAEHERWREDQARRSTGPTDEGHAARLARSLLDVGATAFEVREQLRRWHFDEATAGRAMARATAA